MAQSSRDGVWSTGDGDRSTRDGRRDGGTQHISGHSYFCHSGVGINYCSHDNLAHLHMCFQEQESVSSRAPPEGIKGEGTTSHFTPTSPSLIFFVNWGARRLKGTIEEFLRSAPDVSISHTGILANRHTCVLCYFAGIQPLKSPRILCLLQTNH